MKELFVIIFVFGSLFALYIFSEIKRKNSIRNYCKKNGLVFINSSDYIPNCREKFYITSIGKSNSFNNIIVGEKNGIKFSILDYDYRKTGKDSSDKQQATICVFNKPSLKLPKFRICHKDNFIRLSGIKEEKEICLDFQGDNDFSQRFVLKGFEKNDNEIRKFFSYKIRDVFVHHPKPEISLLQGLHYEYEASNDFFIVWQMGELDLDSRLKLFSNTLILLLNLIETMNSNKNF